MFKHAIQPPIVSLFSSVDSSPLRPLWAIQTDPKLPENSFITQMDDTTSGATEDDPNGKRLLPLPKEYEGDIGKQVNCPVLHIQSPNIATTYIVSPPSGELDLTHSWVHLQVRNLHKDFAFEVGIMDTAGRKGRIRWSTFQQTARVHFPQNTMRATTTASTKGPLLHIPLSFPTSTSRPLTAWCTIDVHLPPLLAQFSASELHILDPDSPRRLLPPIPSGGFKSIGYIKVYANCRLRRVWVSQNGERDGWPEEFRLYEVV